MAVFDNEEDRKTVKVIALWAVSFAVLTVFLIALSIYITA